MDGRTDVAISRLDVESGIFFVFPEVCSLSDLANIADLDQVLHHAAS